MSSVKELFLGAEEYNEEGYQSVSSITSCHITRSDMCANCKEVEWRFHHSDDIGTNGTTY